MGLTTLGITHTAISLIALGSGALAFAKLGEITLQDAYGRTYLVATLLTAATALGIFQHGGFGPPHLLALLTLVALVLGTVAATTAAFGGYSRPVQIASFSATYLFHLIPGFTETLTRLPADHPILQSAEAPELKAISGVLLLGFLVGVAFQIRHARRTA